MPTDTPDPNRYCPECERWRSPAPYCPECKCKTRDATEQELTGAEIPDGSLAFHPASENMVVIKAGYWYRDGDNDAVICINGERYIAFDAHGVQWPNTIIPEIVKPWFEHEPLPAGIPDWLQKSGKRHPAPPVKVEVGGVYLSETGKQYRKDVSMVAPRNPDASILADLLKSLFSPPSDEESS